MGNTVSIESIVTTATIIVSTLGGVIALLWKSLTATQAADRKNINEAKLNLESKLEKCEVGHAETRREFERVNVRLARMQGRLDVISGTVEPGGKLDDMLDDSAKED